MLTTAQLKFLYKALLLYPPYPLLISLLSKQQFLQRKHSQYIVSSNIMSSQRIFKDELKLYTIPASYDVHLQLLPVEGRQSTQSTIGGNIGRGQELFTWRKQQQILKPESANKCIRNNCIVDT